MPISQRTDKALRKDFDQFVNNTGCDKAADKLACLREVPYETIVYAQNLSPNGMTSYQVFSASIPTSGMIVDVLLNSLWLERGCLVKTAYS
jgi:hypothetical protein